MLKNDAGIVQIDNFLDEEDFKTLKNKCKEISDNFEINKYYKEYGRFDTSFYIPDEIEQKFMKKLNDTLDLDNKLIYAQLLKYKMVDGCIPNLGIHKDSLACELKITFCIEKQINGWKFCVENKIFEDKENSVIAFDGNKYTHFRTPYPSESENDFLTVMLIHTADKSYWANKVDEKYYHLITPLSVYK